ncbi:hypothetical protein CS0771_49780 [Catellatospora sp. IY07-71]|uniref:hypothetical protein n=1 Tax=Catellatospora sp. IY07-71 TaxID=2728827 RepID=UPI001BB43009|nr:hypothetical protein [Catellatospora sp. IY07-71]BCJ75434.1 hypothetical protein CS0771_49780 [Catellatospora sp. IY07-71]
MHSLGLTWSEPNDDVGATAYRVYASQSSDVPVTAANLRATVSGTSYRHGPLRAAQTWYYRVVALDAAGNVGPASGVVGGTARGRTVSDVNGDGRDDTVDFTRGTLADVYASVSDGSRFVPNSSKWHDFFAVDQELPLAGDFDGAGRDDIITFTLGGTGDVYAALSTGTAFGPGQKWHDSFAPGTDLPRPGLQP